jgi:hypothetical protein
METLTMRKVKVFKPGHRYRLTRDYHRENWPLKYDAKAGDILIFEYKTVGGFVQFYKTKPDEDGRYHPVMMKAAEAFELLEELESEGS